jgi:hypothetical protein
MLKKSLLILTAVTGLTIANYAEAKSHKAPHSTLQTTEEQRTLASATEAATNVTALKLLVYGLALNGAGKADEGETIINKLIEAGTAIDLNPGDVVTVHDTAPVSGMAGVSVADITYEGQNYLMLVLDNTF